MARAPHRSHPTALCLLILCSLLAPSFAPARTTLAAGPNCAVGSGGAATYATVQAAVNDPGCTTIDVAAGTYAEHLTINRSVLIRGAGAASTILDGGQNGRVLSIAATAAQVQVQNVTIQRGSITDSGRGSAIANAGALTLSNSSVTDNWAGTFGLGSTIFNTGELNLSNSQVIKNRAMGGYAADVFNYTGKLNVDATLISQNEGGGISNWGGAVTIAGSTISANTGLGIFNRSMFLSPNGINDVPYTATLTLANTTISGNTGGGINNSGIYALKAIATLTNVTLGDNRSSNPGDALWNDPISTIALKNSMIVRGSANGNCYGTIESLGHNLEDTNTCALAGAGDLHGVDPLLSPLRDNGGPQPTYALLPGSPAIDAGDNAGCPSTDQRGVARPKDGNADGTPTCDIGAYEYQADPLISSFSPSSIVTGGSGFTLTLSGANFTTGSTVDWNGTPHPATLTSATQLTISIGAAEIATGAIVPVRVVGLEGKRSNLAPFTVNNPLPRLTSISPTFVSPSGAPATIIVNGANFVGTSAVTLAQFDKLPTTFLSSTQLRATLPAWIATSGKLDLSVTNPEPGGGTSNIMTLDVGMEYAGSIGGGVPTVAVSGARAYIGEGSQLTVLEISNPAAPARLGSLTTRERVQDVEIVGSRLYLTDDHDGLMIVDVADPAHPTLLGSIDTPGYAYDVQVDGNRAYVADGDGGLRIFDVSDSAHPAELGSFDTWPAYDLTVVNNVAYIATGPSATLTLVDVSDPAKPTELTSWFSQYSTFGVQVAGNVAYVTTGNNGLVLLNVADPHVYPGEIGHKDLLGKLKDLAIVGTRAYAVNYDGTLHILDVSNSAQPQLLSSYDTRGGSWDVRVVGDRAYVADGVAGLLILDVANPQAVQKLGSYATWSASDVTVSGDRAYIAGGVTGMQILDVGNPAAPTWLGGLSTSGLAANVQVAGDRVYVAKRELWDGIGYSGGGLEIVSVADPVHPTSLGNYPLASAQRVQVVGDRAYVAGLGGLFILNISQRRSRQLARRPTSITQMYR
jgi:hypothetical protein